jgi:hypothetical protein
MAALATRAFVAAGGDFYLCPLSENQLSRQARLELLQPVFDGTQTLQPVYRPGPQGQPDELVAEGFSVDVELTATVDEKQVCWTERRWLVRSAAYAQAQQTALQRRLEKATKQLRELVVCKQGKKQLFHAELMQAAAAIGKREGVEGVLSYSVQALLRTRHVRAYLSLKWKNSCRRSLEANTSRKQGGRGPSQSIGTAFLVFLCQPNTRVVPGGLGCPP